MWNKKCGMEQLEFTSNLKSLISRFKCNGSSFFAQFVTFFNVLVLVLA